jgi:hypothetical protein
VVFPDAGEWTLELGLGQLAFDPNATTVSVAAPADGGVAGKAAGVVDLAACT